MGRLTHVNETVGVMGKLESLGQGGLCVCACVCVSERERENFFLKVFILA